MQDNSHGHMISRYQEELDVYNTIIDSRKGTYMPYGYELTEEEIKLIQKSKQHRTLMNYKLIGEIV